MSVSGVLPLQHDWLLLCGAHVHTCVERTFMCMAVPALLTLLGDWPRFAVREGRTRSVWNARFRSVLKRPPPQHM